MVIPWALLLLTFGCVDGSDGEPGTASGIGTSTAGTSTSSWTTGTSSTSTSTTTTSTTTTSTTSGTTSLANSDADCLTDAEEAGLGTDPLLADTDGDGVDDCDEVACVSDPLDVADLCYACGWPHGDPGDLGPVGTETGDTYKDMSLVDACEETVRLWDFAGTYAILYVTAEW